MFNKAGEGLRLQHGVSTTDIPVVVLSDKNGKKRIEMAIAADTTPYIQTLDASGKAVFKKP